MWRLAKYLEENNDFESLLKNQGELAQKLCEIWPTSASSTSSSEIDNNSNNLSREHKELAAAVASAMWLGRRAQMIKQASGDRTAEQFFLESIVMAFDVGRRSEIVSPH